jgi:hypothetical protein
VLLWSTQVPLLIGFYDARAGETKSADLVPKARRTCYEPEDWNDKVPSLLDRTMGGADLGVIEVKHDGIVGQSIKTTQHLAGSNGWPYPASGRNTVRGKRSQGDSVR